MNSSFLQSHEWEQFQNSLGRKTWRAEGALLIEHDLPGGFCYLYSPRPELKRDTPEQFLKEAKKIGRKEGAIFLKIDPLPQFTIHNSKFKINESSPLQPRRTIVINLQKSEEELLEALHEKTRYNIRLAERKRVFIDYDAYSIIGIFLRLLEETSRRAGFSLHPREHYRKLLEIRSRYFYNEIFFARYDGSIPAAALVNFYVPSGTATYLHGASSRDHQEVMAPHLLHWRIMKEAKSRGFKYYDLGGIDEKRWPGVTRFKLGFGGQIVEYPPSLDVLYRKTLYMVYRIARNFR